MEQPLNSPVSLSLGYWREKVKTLAGNIFDPPYLPPIFIYFFLLTNVTHIAITFMNQPLSYWYEKYDQPGMAHTGWVVPMTPMDWVVFGAVYLSIALVCLTVFNYRWGLLGWFTAEMVHFSGISSWLDGCRFSRWSLSAGAFCEAYDIKIFWIAVAIPIGLLLAAALRPNGYPLPQQRMDKGISIAAIFFSAAWSLLLLIGISSPAQKPTTGWVPLDLDRTPPPLEHSAYAYDTTRNRLVLFGGAAEYVNERWVYKNQTWEWNGKAWLNVSPPLKDSPAGRVSAGMAYDENRKVVVLYGGYNQSGELCDTWEWNGEKWTNRCPAKCPGARSGHEMYYDPVRAKIILYGGHRNNDFFNDAWEWDGSTWAQIEIAGDSPVASGFALAYNPDEDFAFGFLSGTPGGTWTFTGTRWTRLSPLEEPSNRGGAKLAYEPNRKIFVTFGGYSGEFSLNDTWLFDGKNWKRFTDGALQPSVRSNAIVWYDRARRHVMLFGGYHHRNNIVYNDMWELILPEK